MSTDVTEASPHGRRHRRAGYLEALAAIAAATAVAWVMSRFVDRGALSTTYLLAVVGVAARHGRGPAIATSIGGVLAFDLCFVPPYFTLAVADAQDLLTFGVMLVVGVVVGSLTARIRRHADEAAHRERWSVALSAMSAALARTADVRGVAETAAHHLAETFGAEVVVLLPDAAGILAPVNAAAGVPADERERRVIASVFAERRPAGLGTTEAGDAPALYVPLLVAAGAVGVVVVTPRRRGSRPSPEARRQLDTFVSHAALALERCRLADEAQAARLRVETEQVRSSLLTSVSHDLRTPLTAITGAATTLLDAGDRLDGRTRAELLESVRDEADRLHRLVHNLLEMTRLESGALRVRRAWHPLEEVVGAALGRLARSLDGRHVAVTVPPDMPLVAIDDVLVEQVLVNLLDNAIKYTPPTSAIRIVVTAGERQVTVEVADHGPGLPPGEEQRVFDKFHRAGGDGRRGAGLGLAICRGIVQVHGGRIWAQNLPEGGVAFLFTLPLGDTQPLSVPADA